MRKIYILTFIAIVALLSSCSNEVDYGELYKKIVYIINSKETLYYAQHDVSTDSKGNISIYVTGSELPKEDIHISYVIDNKALEEYNKKEYGDRTSLYFVSLPENLCSFETEEVTINKGEPYGCLNFTINTQPLESNKAYILPITISKADRAEISETMNTILYVIQINNEYAGDYIATCYLNNVAKGDFNKKVSAINSKKILVPLANKTNTLITKPLDMNSDYYQISINTDNSLIIEPYLQAIVHEDTENTSYYDSQEKIFYVYYKIEDKYGNDIAVKEIIKAI